MAYTRFEDSDIVLSSETVSTPIWSNDLAILTSGSMKLSDTQKSSLSANYYLDVYYSTGSTVESTDPVQFAIAYADVLGSGSKAYDNTYTKSPSMTTYGQYRSLILGDEESKFYLGGTDQESPNFWAVSVDRARYKESFVVGSLELTLSGSSGTIVLFDKSTGDSVIKRNDSGRAYDIVKSGSTTDIYGCFLPDIGTILLDCTKLAGYAPVVRYPSNTDVAGESYTVTQNAEALFNAITSFKLNAQETVSSNYVFVRAKNSEFNYSVNPSNIESNGELKWKVMINSPETYITSVGLYNDTNDLLAVAKLSRPLAKNFNKEALIRVKLDY